MASVAALRLGASEGVIISLSQAGQIGGEHCVDDAQLTQLNAALQADANHHVTVVAATGDTGAAGELSALINALSAGGTTLAASHTTVPGPVRPPGGSRRQRRQCLPGIGPT